MRMTPSSDRNVAPTGQTCVHGDSSQWLHSFGTKKARSTFLLGMSSANPLMPPSGEVMLTVPSSWTTYRSIHVRKCSGGTLFSFEHASTHFPHPMHFSTSIAIE